MGKGENSKGKFCYQQQTKEWVENQLSSKDSNEKQLNNDSGQTNLLSVQNPTEDFAITLNQA
jgi:hypothetical protein